MISQVDKANRTLHSTFWNVQVVSENILEDWGSHFPNFPNQPELIQLNN